MTDKEKLLVFGRLSSIAESLESIAESLDTLSSCVHVIRRQEGDATEFYIREDE